MAQRYIGLLCLDLNNVASVSVKVSPLYLIQNKIRSGRMIVSWTRKRLVGELKQPGRPRN